MILALVLIIFAYLVGAIPTGYILARACGVADIRMHGSGNIGATNVARVLGFKYFFVVFALDCCKAYATVSYVNSLQLPELVSFLVCCSLFFGNIASVFLQFQGGRGIATGVGIVAAIAPTVLAAVFVPWVLLFALTRTVGIASICGLLALPVCALVLAGHSVFVVAIAMLIAVVGLVRHRIHIMAVIKSLNMAR